MEHAANKKGEGSKRPKHNPETTKSPPAQRSNIEAAEEKPERTPSPGSESQTADEIDNTLEAASDRIKVIMNSDMSRQNKELLMDALMRILRIDLNPVLGLAIAAKGIYVIRTWGKDLDSQRLVDNGLLALLDDAEQQQAARDAAEIADSQNLD